MTVLTDRLEYPNLRKTFLLHLTAGEHLFHWTSSGGGVYHATTVAGPSRPVVDVKEDGASLAEGASASLSAGQWWWDRANARVYVHPTGSVSPYTVTLQALLQFHFSNRGRVYNGVYYEPCLAALPDLSIRVEPMFGDVGQLGAGNLALINRGGFFDALSDLQWDAGTVGILMGADDPKFSSSSLFYQQRIGDFIFADSSPDSWVDDGGYAWADDMGVGILEPVPVYAQALYADFDTVGTFLVRHWEMDRGVFVLKLEEIKGRTKKKIPLSFYSRDDYPSMEEDRVGEPIPLAYGTIRDIRPTCIDLQTRQFKVADTSRHAIKGFLGCRVKDESTEAWADVGFDTRDTATGTFTLASDDWDRKAEVAVDFEGYVDSDGYLMENAADVVEDILAVIGETDLYAASFTESWGRLNSGYDNVEHPVTHKALSLYIDKEEEAFKIVSRINECVGSYLFCDHSGQYRYKVFEPEPGASAPLFTDREIFSVRETTDATEIVSKVRAEYQYRTQQDYPQVYIFDRARGQYLSGAPAARLKTLEKLCVDTMGDAMYVAQRTARMEGERQRTYKAIVSHRAWTYLPGNFIRLQHSRFGLDAIFEIMEVRRSLTDKSNRVELAVGDLHGMKDQSGSWTADAPVFPDSLGGGSAETWSSGWTAAQKAYARQNFGYWTDDDGFIDSADPDSYLGSVWF